MALMKIVSSKPLYLVINYAIRKVTQLQWQDTIVLQRRGKIDERQKVEEPEGCKDEAEAYD